MTQWIRRDINILSTKKIIKIELYSSFPMTQFNTSSSTQNVLKKIRKFKKENNIHPQV